MVPGLRVGTILDPKPFLNNDSNFESNSDLKPVLSVLDTVAIGKSRSGFETRST